MGGKNMLASKRLMLESVIEQTACGKMKPNGIKGVNILDHTAINGDYSIVVFMQDGHNYYAQGSRKVAYDKLFHDMKRDVNRDQTN
jgi:hypothetical protein